MPTATLTSKGQTTIPKEVRDHLHLEAGDRVEFLLGGRDVILRAATLDVKKLKGILHREGMRPVSVEEMNRAIRKRGGTQP